MQAIVHTEYGPPELLELREIGEPVAGDKEVLIRVHAASVNPADWFVLTGKPFPVRLAFGLVRPKHEVLGMDVAGEVQAVGKGVTRFRPGDEVFGEIVGAYAEYVCAPEHRLALKPANLSFEQAAAVPMAGVTALQGLHDKAGVKPGDKVLINGASGGVGTFAVQIAKAFGAEVTGVCSTRNLDLVRSIGADHLVDYTQADFTQTSTRYDAIFDLVGSASLSACRRILSPTGVYISSMSAMDRLLEAVFMSLVPWSKVVVLTAQATPEDLAALRGLVEAGEVTPVIDRAFTLSEVPEALRQQGVGHARGKSVIRI